MVRSYTLSTSPVSHTWDWNKTTLTHEIFTTFLWNWSIILKVSLMFFGFSAFHINGFLWKQKFVYLAHGKSLLQLTSFFLNLFFRCCGILLSLLSINIIHIQTCYTEGFINTFDGFNNVTAKTKWSFSLSIFSVNVINSAVLYPLKTLENKRFSDIFWGYRTVDLVTFTEEILNGKLHFFVQCAVKNRQFMIFVLVLLVSPLLLSVSKWPLEFSSLWMIFVQCLGLAKVQFTLSLWNSTTHKAFT